MQSWRSTNSTPKPNPPSRTWSSVKPGHEADGFARIVGKASGLHSNMCVTKNAGEIFSRRNGSESKQTHIKYESSKIL